MARVRSPNYPALSLPDAAKRVGQVFAKENRHKMPRDVLVKHLGYNTVNGASLGAISACLKYGLLSQEGDQYQVTDRALAILHPRGKQERSEAIILAAREPTLFSDILSDFKGTPPSDENLRSYLVRRGFAQSALTGVIQAFRETMDLVGQESGGYDAVSNPPFEDDKDVPAPPEPFFPSSPGQDFKPVRAPQRGAPYQVSMSPGQLTIVATIRDRGTAAAIIKVIEMNKELLPEMAATPEAGEKKAD